MQTWPTHPKPRAIPSIKRRIAEIKNQTHLDLGQAIQTHYEQGFLLAEHLPLKPLLVFNPDQQTLHNELPFSLTAYIELVDWTGRIIRENKRGYIEKNLPPILQRLNIPPKQWITQSASKTNWLTGRTLPNNASL